MEAAAIAWVCELSMTPFLGLKVVTDIVDGDKPTHEEFLENLHTAAVSLQNVIPKVLDFIIGKKLSEL
jgi:5'-methylthioadenosine nucleosidase